MKPQWNSDNAAREVVMGLAAAAFCLAASALNIRAATPPDFSLLKQVGGPSWDHAASVGLDAAGNVYVAGQFSDVAWFDTVSLTSAGDSDVFLAKYDPAGALQWVVSVGGPGPDAWTPIARITLSRSAELWFDPQPASLEKRFYRAVVML